MNNVPSYSSDLSVQKSEMIHEMFSQHIRQSLLVRYCKYRALHMIISHKKKISSVLASIVHREANTVKAGPA